MPRRKDAPYAKCSVKNCARDANKPGAARGFCPAHYRRWNLYGDPLGTKQKSPPQTEQWICDVALTYLGDDCLIWPFQRNVHGYGVIASERRPHIASRVICERAHGAPPDKAVHAAHSCNNGRLGCVNPRHLAWKTAAENERDKVAVGRDNAGSRHGMSKLTEDDVRTIRNRKDVSAEEMAFRFNVSKWAIFDIRSGRRWGHIA